MKPGRKFGLATLFAVAVVVASSPAGAACPDEGSPSTRVCDHHHAMFMPSAAGMFYAPGDAALGPWLGGGLQIVLFTWSDNSPSPGPGQGKIRFDIGVLGSSEDAAGSMILYRGGVTVSFEKNASRAWLIPFYGAALGGLHEPTLGGRGFVTGSLGLHLWYSTGFIVDVEGSYLLPFKDADLLAGPMAQLSLSFALW